MAFVTVHYNFLCTCPSLVLYGVPQALSCVRAEMNLVWFLPLGDTGASVETNDKSVTAQCGESTAGHLGGSA